MMQRLRYILWTIIFCSFACGFASSANAVVAGTRDYNFANHQMLFYDGTAWYGLNISVPLGTCSNEGAMEFDSFLASYEVCNGTFWIKIIGIPTLAACSKKGAMDFNGSTYLVCNGLVWTDIKGNLFAT